MTQPEGWALRDGCALPPLIDGTRVTPPGETFTCPHGFAWTAQWVQVHGGQPQPQWVCSALPDN